MMVFSVSDEPNPVLYARLDQIIQLLGELREIAARERPRPQRLLKTKDAAAYLAISPKALRRLIQQGEIPHIATANGSGGVWLCDTKDLDAWISRAKV